MRKIILILSLVYVSWQQVKIKCYDCITPIGVADVTKYCNSSLYCKGQYCTKGPNALSNGIEHGCNDNPPLESGGTKCKLVTTNTGVHSNCYCKNIDFCNGQSGSNYIILTIFSFIMTILVF